VVACEAIADERVAALASRVAIAGEPAAASASRVATADERGAASRSPTSAARHRRRVRGDSLSTSTSDGAIVSAFL
jgi:hypothetical protein